VTGITERIFPAFKTHCVDANNTLSKMASEKSEDNGALLMRNALQLMDYLRLNSNLQIALHLYQLFKEQILRVNLAKWQLAEAEQFDSQVHWELLEACVHKVYITCLRFINALILISNLSRF
jgi:hypothetical protein